VPSFDAQSAVGLARPPPTNNSTAVAFTNSEATATNGSTANAINNCTATAQNGEVVECH
jgi:hypothetical protein